MQTFHKFAGSSRLWFCVRNKIVTNIEGFYHKIVFISSEILSGYEQARSVRCGLEFFAFWLGKQFL